ncbi:MAG: SPASM domain-containing protein [Desulfobacterales bacterium]
MNSTDQTANRSMPAYLQFYPTLRCNFDCDFCFNRQLPDCGDVSIENFQKMVSVCQANGIRHIDMLGGEPTLHTGLFEMLDLLVDAGLMSTISTNGSRVETLWQISDRYPRESVRLGISMNSEDVAEPLHQYILSRRPILKTIFSKHDLIPEAFKPYIGFQGIEFYLLYRDILNSADLLYSLPFEAFYSRLVDIKKAYTGVDGVFCSGFLPDPADFPELGNVRCPAGTTKLSVLPDGRVYPCYLLFRYREFELGNLFEDDFDTIWQHPTLVKFRHFEGNQCPQNQCALHQRCHGGCPAVSYMFYKDLNAPDPRCVYPVNQ